VEATLNATFVDNKKTITTYTIENTDKKKERVKISE